MVKRQTLLEVLIQGKLSSKTGNEKGLLLPLDFIFLLLETGLPRVDIFDKVPWGNQADPHKKASLQNTA